MSSSDDNPIEYFDILNVDLCDDLSGANDQVRSYSVKFVQRQPDGIAAFDWPSFKSAIDDYDGSALTFDSLVEDTFSETNPSVTTIPQKISNTISGKLGVPSDLSALTQKLETIIKSIQDDCFRDTLSCSRSDLNHAWEYRIIFGYPSPTQRDFLYSVVTTIKFARICAPPEKHGWFGLTTGTSSQLSAKVLAIRLVVGKHFHA